MKKYHKIQTVYKRDPETKYKTLLEGEYSLPEFEYLQDNEWVYTEKVDGMNMRIIFDDGKLVFRGKTDRAQLPSNLVIRLSERFYPQLKTFEENFGDGICLYGEGYGAGIQKGGCYSPDQDFVLFDIKIGDLWLRREDVEGIGEMFDLVIVPIIGKGSLHKMVEMVRNGLDSTWINSAHGDFEAEGIVARPSAELRTRNGGRMITKIKCKDLR